MGRIRSIKPDFFSSLTIGELSVTARLTFIGLWCYVDDNGVGLDDVRLIRAAVWPLEDDPNILARIREDLANLSQAGLITRYEFSRKPLLAVTSWREHQKVDHPKKPRFPRPEELPDPPPEQENERPREDFANPSRGLRSRGGEHLREDVDEHPDDAHDEHHGEHRDAHDEHRDLAPHDLQEDHDTGQMNTTSRGLREDFVPEQGAGSREQGAGSSLAHPDADAHTADAQPEPPARTAREKEDSAEFVRFWSAYPRRKAKDRARRAWAKATKSTDPEVIIAAARAFAAQRQGQDPQYTPYPSTWLNSEGWLDEPDPPSSPGGDVVPFNSRQQASDDLFDRAMDRAKQREAQMGIGDAQ